MTDSPRQTPLRMIGVILLLASIGVGGYLYWHAVRADVDSDDEAMRAQEQSRAYELAMQKNVGPVGLLMNRWGDRLASPQGVAAEVTLAGVVAAGFCFALAARPPQPR